MARCLLSLRRPAALLFFVALAPTFPARAESPPAPAVAPRVDAGEALRRGEDLVRQAEATETEGATLFGQAAEAFQAALSALSKEERPADWAQAQTRLAAALVSQAERTLGQAAWDQLEAAKAAARGALEVLDAAHNAPARAAAQHQLGRALRAQGAFISGAEGETLRAEALSALRAALQGLDPKDGFKRAMVEADLGLALFSDAQRSENDKARQQLAEAAGSFRASLATFTAAANPREWGDAQNLLGHSLREQFLRSGGGADEALVKGAIAAYEAALSVRPREKMPVAWLLIKNNLGTAKQLLATVKEGEEKAELLRQGFTSIGEALEVATPEAYPQFWAPLRENQLGILIDQGEKEKASQAIVEILGLPPELGAEIKPSLLQILDKLPPELRDDPSELVARLREVLMRSMDPAMEDQHGPPEGGGEGNGADTPAPPAGGG